MRHSRWLAALAACAMVVFVAQHLWGASPKVQRQPEPEVAAPSTRSRDDTLTPPTSAPAPPALLGVAASLRGTEPDGAIRIAPDGTVQLDLELRLRFDYYLSSYGERSLAEIRVWLESELKGRYPKLAVGEVMRLFDLYLAYQAATTRLDGIKTPLERLKALHALRVELLGARMAEGFFGAEEQEDSHTLARQALAANGQLSPKESAQQAERLISTLPEPAREALVQSVELGAAVDQTRAFDAEGISAAERFAKRQEKYGPAAAQRLQALDAKRIEWRTRLSDFRHQRDEIVSDASSTAPHRAQAVERLISRLFADPAEERRVRALELESRSAY